MLRQFSSFILLLLFTLLTSVVSAQQPQITQVQPNQIVSGQSVTLTIQGENFTNPITVTLNGYGQLTVNNANATTITADLPGNVPAGQYALEVNVDGTPVTMPNAVTVQSPTAVPQVNATSSEPKRIIVGQSATLAIRGNNFTATTQVRLFGYGDLNTTFVDATRLRAFVPNDVPVGQYDIVVDDTASGGGTSIIGRGLHIQEVPPPPTAQPEPTETLPPPSPLPGQPSLLVSGFTSNPSTISAGDSVTLTFTVVNQGNRMAEGVSVALDSGSQFVAASGQAAVPLPNINPGSAYTASITITASNEAPAGPVPVPLTLTYRDFSAEVYTSKAELSVNVLQIEQMAQITLDNYAVDPNPVVPGEAVIIRATITNAGNQIASGVLVRVNGSENVLFAGPEGDSFTLGDIQPGETAAVVMPLIASSAAEAGPQSQSITISYFRNGESQQVSDSLTINIAQVETPEALLLLSSYETSEDVLKPGDRFTLTMALQNVGAASANNLLITFGTVESSSDGGSGSGGSGSGSGSTQTTSTSPSSTFAPLGNGGRIYMGNLASGLISEIITQDFMVSGDVDSGIYNLPITLNYLKADNSAVKETLYAGVVVIVPPRLLITLDTPLPESVNVGEPLPISLTLVNAGTAKINLTGAEVTGGNAEVLEGAQTTLSPLSADDDVNVAAMFVANDEGEVTVNVSLHYIDDLNREQTIDNIYSTEALMPPPPPEEVFEPEPVVTEEPVEEDDFLQRLLFGLLGLGS